MGYKEEWGGGFDAPLNIEYHEVRPPMVRHVESQVQGRYRYEYSLRPDWMQTVGEWTRPLSDPLEELTATTNQFFDLTTYEARDYSVRMWRAAPAGFLPPDVIEPYVLDIEHGKVDAYGWWEQIVYTIWVKLELK